MLLQGRGKGEARRGTDRIVQTSGARGEIGLLEIRLDKRRGRILAETFRVSPQMPLKALTQLVDDFGVPHQLKPSRRRQGYGLEVVSGWAQTA